MNGLTEFRAAAQDWFDYAEDDLRMAKIGMDRGGPPNTILFLLQQAVEKNLKGYLIWHSGSLTKTHNLEMLIDKASSLDPALVAFTDLGRRLTATYTFERYPPGPRVTPEPAEVVAIFEQAKKLIGLIKGEFGKE